jgi:SMI1-KNR4 cell-wall
MEIFDEINNLIKRSNGLMLEIQSGETYSFTRKRIYNNLEIEKFESKWKIKLPLDYKLFLTTVGSCELFFNEYKLGFEFHSLESIEEKSKLIFQEMNNPFPSLLLVVSLTGRGDEGGFDMNRNDQTNFSVFSHEDDPELWVEETHDWISFSEWLNKLIKSDGQDDLP